MVLRVETMVLATVFALWVSLAGPTTGIAAPSMATAAPHSVVALRGTPHLWIADDAGTLHWAGDTRALAGKLVDWGNRIEVDLSTLKGYQIGDPWLSAGLLKIGEPIYLVKWESNQAQPVLQHIQSLDDVALFGINGSNYGNYVTAPDAWEARFKITVSGLTKEELPSAAPTTAAGSAGSVPAAPKPSTAMLVVPTQALIGGRGAWEGVGWVVGEVRNDGGAQACGYTVSVTVKDGSGNVLGAKQMDTYFQLAPGASLPFGISWFGLPSNVQHMEVTAAERSTGYCPYVPLTTEGVNARKADGLLPTYHATGTIKNNTGSAKKSVRVVVGFYDGGGNLVDVQGSEMGTRANVDALAPGQSTVFDVESETASGNARVANITSAKAFAFGERT